MTKAHILDGKSVANGIIDELKVNIAQAKRGRPPGLATVLVGDDPASQVYVKNKRKKALYAGIKSFHYHLPADITQDELLELVKKLNEDQNIDGILVQLPLPRQICESSIVEAIDAKKDVDGFHPLNMGYLFLGTPKVIPCTPFGIMHLIRTTGYSLSGKHVVVVGRSNIVGKPIAQLLLNQNATVTICHSKTENIKEITKQADLIVAAVGRAKMIDKSFVKPGAFVIDVGINRDENNNLVGDVDFYEVKDIASFITPVPGGVGPLTIAMLLKNTYQNYQRTAV